MNIIYKDAKMNPSEDLIKLTQFTGAYSAATMDKASEVTQLMKQKDVQVAMFEEQVAENQ